MTTRVGGQVSFRRRADSCDAYTASVARAYACPVASFDRDFRRFDDLEIVVRG